MRALTRSVPRSLVLSVALAACGGTRTPPPEPTTHASNVPAHAPVPVDTALADAPADAAIIVRADADAIRQSVYFAVIQQMASTSGLTVACDGDPLAHVDHLTAAFTPDGHASVVVRGPIVDDANGACATALGRALSIEAPPERIGTALLFAVPERVASARAALIGGLNARSNETLTSLRNASRVEGITALVDFARIRPTAEAPNSPLPGLDAETTVALWNAFAGGSFSLALPHGNEVGLGLRAAFDNAAHAEQARAWLSALTARRIAEFRAQIEANHDPSFEAMRPQALALVDHVRDAIHFSTDGTSTSVSVDLDAQSAGGLSAVVIPAFITYMRRAKTTEARARIAYASRMAADYATRDQSSSPPPARPRGRRGANATPPSPFPPSAPRTPADVPSGVRVVDPAGTWSHPTWQALSFAFSDPHYYSYEFVNQGNAFTIRAYGDLDGDGTLSTFERSGRMNANHEVVLDPEVHTTNELE